MILVEARSQRKFCAPIVPSVMSDRSAEPNRLTYAFRLFRALKSNLKVVLAAALLTVLSAKSLLRLVTMRLAPPFPETAKPKLWLVPPLLSALILLALRALVTVRITPELDTV